MEIADYMAMFRWHKTKFSVTFLAVLLASLVLAFSLPSVYRSTATILINQQEIPSDIVASTVQGYVEQRLELITKRVMTQDNLWGVAEKLDLYPDERQLEDKETIVGRIQENIVRETISVETIDPKSGRASPLTVAFSLSFDAETPELAQKVVDELAMLYLDENSKARTEQAAGVSQFLLEEADRLNRQISELEDQLSVFRQEHLEELPERADVNLRLIDQTEIALQNAEEKIRSLEERQIPLQAQLAITKANEPIYTDQGQKILTGTQRLSMLRAAYLSAAAIYSSDHPDLIRMRREIEVMEKGTADAGKTDELAGEFKVLQAKLDEARQKYSEEHPDVRKLRNAVAALEKEMRAAPATRSSVASENLTLPDNPAYITLQGLLDTVTSSLNAEKVKQRQLEERLMAYRQRLFQTPAVEREYQMLSRNHQHALEKYREIRDKQMEAHLAEQLERALKAERFSLLEPASLPRGPASPNRPGLALLGVVLALGSGIGTISVAEYLDRTVRGFRGVAAILQAPPLAGIPYIQTKEDIARKRKRRLTAIFLVTAAVVFALTLGHFFGKPLDQMLLEDVQDVVEAPPHSQTTAE